MKINRLHMAVLAALLGSIALVGCKKKEEPVVATPPPMAEPAPLPPAPPATPFSVASVALGNAIGADNTVATPLTTFAKGDTIHASVTTDGAAGKLTAKWSHLDSSQTVSEETRDVPAGPQVTEFRVSNPGGWPLGKYKLEVSADGAVVSTADFEVK